MTRGDSYTEPTCNIFVRTVLRYISQKYFLPSNCRLGITQEGSDPALFLNNSKKYESGNERTSLNLKHWFDNQYTNLANYLLDIAHNQHGQRKNRYHDDHGNDICEESDFDNSELQSFKTNDELYVNFGTKNESADAIELNQHEGHECHFLDNKLQSNNDPEGDEHHQEVFTPHGYIYTQFDNEMNDYVSRRVSIKNCENVESTKIKEPLDEYDVHSAEGDDTEGDDEDKGQMLSTVFCDNIINKPFNDYVVHAAEGDAAGEGEEEEQEPQVIHGGHHGIRVPAEGEEEEGEECKESEEPTEGEECKDSKRKKHGDHYDHIEHQEEEEETEGEEVDEKKKAEEEKKAQLRRHGAVPQDVWSKADADDFFDEDDADDGPGALPEVSKAADEAILNASANITINHRFNHYHHGEFGKKDGLPGTAPFETRHPNANQTKQCFFMFVDYHRCAAKLGDDVYRCHYYRHVYETICPNEWIQKWQDQMDAGTFPFKIQS